MSSYLFPSRLDKWATILSSLHVNQLSYLTMCQSGGGHIRVKELINAGLVCAHYGRNGGYRLVMPLSDIPFSRLLEIFPHEKCPTLNLFYRYADVPVQEVFQWPEGKKGKHKASIESVCDILSRIHPTIPTMPEDMADLPYSIGYIKHVLATLAPNKLARNCHRRGKVLVKPFNTVTIGDITPVLAHRGRIHSTIVLHSANVKLVDIQ